MADGLRAAASQAQNEPRDEGMTYLAFLRRLLRH